MRNVCEHQKPTGSFKQTKQTMLHLYHKVWTEYGRCQIPNVVNVSSRERFILRQLFQLEAGNHLFLFFLPELALKVKWGWII